jgi:ArsR family transcriptional regulator, arsenate/arsenite/antimonite-responsive transcriptional repressor
VLYFEVVGAGRAAEHTNESDICKYPAREFPITPQKGNIEIPLAMPAKKLHHEEITRYADMFSAIGTESRLRIMQLLLSAHPDGMVVGEIGDELEIPSSTLSHHLEKLKNEDLVNVRREGTYLWYSANTESLQKLLGFLYAECCTRNKAIEPGKIVVCK